MAYSETSPLNAFKATTNGADFNTPAANPGAQESSLISACNKKYASKAVLIISPALSPSEPGKLLTTSAPSELGPSVSRPTFASTNWPIRWLSCSIFERSGWFRHKAPTRISLRSPDTSICAIRSASLPTEISSRPSGTERSSKRLTAFTTSPKNPVI